MICCLSTARDFPHRDVARPISRLIAGARRRIADLRGTGSPFQPSTRHLNPWGRSEYRRLAPYSLQSGIGRGLFLPSPRSAVRICCWNLLHRPSGSAPSSNGSTRLRDRSGHGSLFRQPVGSLVLSRRPGTRRATAILGDAGRNDSTGTHRVDLSHLRISGPPKAVVTPFRFRVRPRRPSRDPNATCSKRIRARTFAGKSDAPDGQTLHFGVRY